MNDNEQQQQREAVANFMGALAHLLTGRPGRHAEFIEKVELVLSGAEPHALQLMQFTSRVRATRRPVIWVHYAPDVPNVPQIGLVAPDGKKVHIIENCMLWMSDRGSRAQLVPDGFNLGCFRFDDRLRLRRLEEAPAPDFQSAQDDMVRAYNRLNEIGAEQRRRGETFKLPSLAKAA
ncbi:hypothetical protein ACM61V_06035 [Sphingomonas sp. TX0543]|uniref:hypothetical protein n=1 Tax=unclassified Sphingomonas TaxID=196159 RepID=UPI0010FA105E|nr:hypothetical protein [Sphingomonas sp. 3P27F8]